MGKTFRDACSHESDECPIESCIGGTLASDRFRQLTISDTQFNHHARKGLRTSRRTCHRLTCSLRSRIVRLRVHGPYENGVVGEQRRADLG